MVATKVEFESESYVGESLTDAERALLLRQLYTYLSGPSWSLNSIFRDNEAAVIGAAEVAKAYIGAPFAGMTAGDAEFGFQHIRAGHVLRTTATTETPNNDWTISFAAGNNNWIGYSTSNGTAINMDKRLLVLPLGVMFTQGGSPVVEELYWQINNVLYPIEVIRQAWWADNVNQIRMARIRPKIIVPKATALVQARATTAGQNQLVLMGLSFARGDLMRTQAPASVQT